MREKNFAKFRQKMIKKKYTLIFNFAFSAKIKRTLISPEGLSSNDEEEFLGEAKGSWVETATVESWRLERAASGRVTNQWRMVG